MIYICIMYLYLFMFIIIISRFLGGNNPTLLKIHIPPTAKPTSILTILLRPTSYHFIGPTSTSCPLFCKADAPLLTATQWVSVNQGAQTGSTRCSWSTSGCRRGERTTCRRTYIPGWRTLQVASYELCKYAPGDPYANGNFVYQFWVSSV